MKDRARRALLYAGDNYTESTIAVAVTLAILTVLSIHLTWLFFAGIMAGAIAWDLALSYWHTRKGTSS